MNTYVKLFYSVLWIVFVVSALSLGIGISWTVQNIYAYYASQYPSSYLSVGMIVAGAVGIVFSYAFILIKNLLMDSTMIMVRVLKTIEDMEDMTGVKEKPVTKLGDTRKSVKRKR